MAVDDIILEVADIPDGTPNLPRSNEKAALQGNGGTPSSTNTFVTEEGFQRDVDAIVQERNDKIQNLQTQLNTEIEARGKGDTDEATARTQADGMLQSHIDSEALARQQADSTLKSSIDAEASARASADETIQGDLDTEAQNRSTADQQLQSSIEQVQTNLGLEATTRAQADTALDNAKVDKATGEMVKQTIQDTTEATEANKYISQILDNVGNIIFTIDRLNKKIIVGAGYDFQFLDAVSLDKISLR